jgi:hypothetical protein
MDDEPMIALISPMESTTSSSLDSSSGGTSLGPAFGGRVAVPVTVLTQPVSRTDAAITAAAANLRLAVPMLVTALL